ncbi:MAG: hypothetical protein IJH12_04555 [Clostridia bacterium]|nr:hypothetical protein [Clostridia bacterium]
MKDKRVFFNVVSSILLQILVMICCFDYTCFNTYYKCDSYGCISENGRKYPLGKTSNCNYIYIEANSSKYIC